MTRHEFINEISNYFCSRSEAEEFANYFTDEDIEFNYEEIISYLYEERNVELNIYHFNNLEY